MNIRTIHKYSARLLAAYGLYLLFSSLTPFAVNIHLRSHGHENVSYVPDGSHIDIVYYHCDNSAGELCKDTHEHKYHLDDDLLGTLRERDGHKTSPVKSLYSLQQYKNPYIVCISYVRGDLKVLDAHPSLFNITNSRLLI